MQAWCNQSGNLLLNGPEAQTVTATWFSKTQLADPMMESKQLNDEIEDAMTDPVDRLLQEKRPASSGKGIAILALLVALAAVSESAWQWWQASTTGAGADPQQELLEELQTAQQRLDESMRSFEAQLDAIDVPVDPGEFSRLDERVASLQDSVAGLEGKLGEDKASMAALQGSVRSNSSRLSAVESGLTTVAASSQNSSVELEIAEIDFLLRVANERLQLFADPSAADLALQAADVQIEALNDPMFLSVRQRIATSRQALAAVPRTDRVELSARITAIQARVQDLPFRGEAAVAPEPELPADDGWWQSFKHTLASLVTVRRRVPDDEAMLSLDDKDYLRQGLWLQLESARLALMRNDASVYQDSLARVNTTVQQFFENGASSVQAFLLDVAALEQAEVAPEMPDINAPWMQLRQIRDSRRLLKSAPPVESAAAVEDGENGE